MSSHLHNRDRRSHRQGSRLVLLLCLLAGSGLAVAAPLAASAQAGQALPESAFSRDRSNRDRQLTWLELQRDLAEQAHRLTLRRLDQLERCLERSRRTAERDDCLRRDLDARERQWQREQRDWQRLLRQQGRIVRLAWQPER